LVLFGINSGKNAMRVTLGCSYVSCFDRRIGWTAEKYESVLFVLEDSVDCLFAETGVLCLDNDK
jgi:hypothetical protein